MKYLQFLPLDSEGFGSRLTVSGVEPCFTIRLEGDRSHRIEPVSRKSQRACAANKDSGESEACNPFTFTVQHVQYTYTEVRHYGHSSELHTSMAVVHVACLVVCYLLLLPPPPPPPSPLQPSATTARRSVDHHHHHHHNEWHGGDDDDDDNRLL